MKEKGGKNKRHYWRREELRHCLKANILNKKKTKKLDLNPLMKIFETVTEKEGISDAFSGFCFWIGRIWAGRIGLEFDLEYLILDSIIILIQ